MKKGFTKDRFKLLKRKEGEKKTMSHVREHRSTTPTQMKKKIFHSITLSIRGVP